MKGTKGETEKAPLLVNEDTPGDKEIEGHATISSSIFNLSANILGSGTLTMPSVCMTSGILVFGGALIVMGALSTIAVLLLIMTVDKLALRKARYSTLGKQVFGKPGEMAADLVIIINQLGACVAYTVIVADVLQPIISMNAPAGSILCSRALIQVIVLAVVIFPLCCLRNMESLKYTSLMAVAFVMCLAIFVTINGIRVAADPSIRDSLNSVGGTEVVSPCDNTTSSVLPPPGTEVHLANLDVGLISVVPVLAFAYTCHQNVFPIYRELKNRNIARMSIVTLSSMTLCGTIYLLAGVFGYLIFLQSAAGDLLLNFRVRGAPLFYAMDVVRVALGVAIMFCYPLVAFELRNGLENIVFGQKEYSRIRHMAINLAIIIPTGIVGIFAPQIRTVLSFTGSTCTPMIVYVFPALYYLKSHSQDTSKWRYAAYTLLIFGIIMIPASLTITALSLK